MFQINVEIDSTRLYDRMEKGVKRLPYAVANALRDTALEVQAAAHANVRRTMIVRKPDFLFGTPGRPGGAAAKIVVFPSVKEGTMYTEIAVGQGKTFRTQRLLLPIFEAGGERKPFTPGAKSVAVPLLGRPARPSLNRGVPPQYTFAGLQFTAYRGGKRLRKRTTRSGAVGVFGEFGRVNLPAAGGKVQWKGLQRTFILPESKKAPFGGVFQRIGPARGDIREIYSFERGIHLPAELHFVDTARRVAAVSFKENMERRTIEALAHSRLVA
jgi:hypothetical protein